MQSQTLKPLIAVARQLAVCRERRSHALVPVIADPTTRKAVDVSAQGIAVPIIAREPSQIPRLSSGVKLFAPELPKYHQGGKVMPMDSARYSERRNELLDKLNEILSIEKLPEQSRKEIQFVHKKLVSNEFNIVLIGEFQGGKSTTFDAVCDGREISPRGSMVKTSACRISAQNLPDADAEEYAELRWKSDEELLMTMVDLISSRLREKNPERFLTMSEPEMVKNLNLANKVDVQLIRECLDDEWAFYCSDRASYDPDSNGILDVLRISLLIAKFVDCPELVELRKKEKIPVDELNQLVTFPDKWEARWTGTNSGDFTFMESAFAFLGGVMCYIHSPNLARLGCVITDCPGLFASTWDTEVARQAMFEADAILYLIGGIRQMSQGDVKALKEIRLANQAHKLFFAVNLRGKKSAFETNILPTDVALLNNVGFEDVKDSTVHLFHALLGLCSRNGKTMAEGTMEECSKVRFVNVAKRKDAGYSDDPKQCWRELVLELLRELGESNPDSIVSDYSKLGAVSGLDVLFDVIEKTVINKKAEALLVTGGSALVNKAFSELEHNLCAQEEMSRKTLEEFEQQAKAARQALGDFTTQAKTEIGRITEERQGKALAYDFFDNVIVKNADALSSQVANGLADKLMNFSSVGEALTGVFKGESEKKKIILDKAMPVLQKAVTDVFTPATEGWLANIYDGKSSVYEESLGQCQRDIIMQLRRQWSKLISADDVLLKGLDERLSPVALTEVITEQVIGAETFDGVTPNAVSVKNKALIMSAMTAPITALIAGVFFIGGNALLALVFGVIVVGWIPILVTAILAILTTRKITDAVKRKARQGFLEKTKTQLRVQLTHPDVKSKVIDGALKLIHDQLQTNLYKCLEKRLEAQRAAFISRCSEAEKAVKASNKEKVILAEEAQRLRTESIEPAHTWCEDFEKNVTAELSV